MINRNILQKKIQEKLANPISAEDISQNCMEYVYIAETFYNSYLEKQTDSKTKGPAIVGLIRLFDIFEECIREENKKVNLNFTVMKDKKKNVKAEKKSNKQTFLNDLKLVKDSYARGRVEKDMIEKLIKRVERRK